MRFCIIRDLITHTVLERKAAPVFEVGVKFPVHTKNDVTFDTPMIGKVTRRVLNHAHTNASEVLGSPVCAPPLTLVFSRRELRPVRGSEWDACYLHERLLRKYCAARPPRALGDRLR